jgi:hypothetical protein
LAYMISLYLLTFVGLPGYIYANNPTGKGLVISHSFILHISGLGVFLVLYLLSVLYTKYRN